MCQHGGRRMRMKRSCFPLRWALKLARHSSGGLDRLARGQVSWARTDDAIRHVEAVGVTTAAREASALMWTRSEP
jgi:hypothetical protein